MSRIALVIPNRNGGRYFADLLQALSILSEWPDEVIILDGMSTDGGFELALAFARQHGSSCRILIEQRAPKGIYDAWNQGIALTSADWIHIICSDDSVMPDAYAQVRQRLRHASGANLETFDCAIIDGAGRGVAYVHQLSQLAVIDPSWLQVAHGRLPLLEALLLYTGRSVTISFVGVLIPAEVARKTQFSTDHGSSGDVEWLLRVSIAGLGVNYTPAVIGAWRVHEGGATAVASGSSRIAAHRNIRRLHAPALLALAAGKLQPWQLTVIREMAQQDIGVDFFDMLADLKRSGPRKWLQVVTRMSCLIVRKYQQRPSVAVLCSKKRLISWLRTTDIETLVAETDLLKPKKIGAYRS